MNTENNSSRPIGLTNIMETQADQTYSLKGDKIKSGRRVTRLKLVDDNDKFNIAIKDKAWAGWNPFKRIYQKACFIKLETNADPIYLNINSLSSRLHLSKHEIKKSSKKRELSTLIEKTLVDQKTIIDSYEKIIINYKTTSINKKLNVTKETILKKETLMKIIRTAVPLFYGKENPESHVFFNENRLFMAKMAENHLQLTLLTNKVLGEGSFGKVSVGITMNSKKEMAFKELKDITEKKSKGLQVEYEMLNLLHENNPNKEAPLRGIQIKPHQFIKFNDLNNKNSVCGYLGEKYETDLTGFACNHAIPIEIKLKQGADILAGVAFLTENNIVHNDLKLDNIFVKRDDNGDIITHIGDFGGAKKIDLKKESTSINSDEQKKFPMDTHTAGYTSLQRCLTAQEKWGEKDYETSKKYLHENDVFATAVILYQYFTGKNPFKFDTNKYPILTKELTTSDLREKQVPEKIISLLEKMLTSNPGETISIQEILSEYEEAIKSIKIPHFKSL